jgi:hypothetical protein
MKTITTFVVGIALVLALSGTALAQSSSVDGYADQAAQIQSQVVGDDSTTTAGGGDGSLPFTGLDVALLAGAGGLLVAAGLGMRRLTRAPGNA